MRSTKLEKIQTDFWIELKRADFLEALKTIKPTHRVKSAPERELQIGLINQQVILSIQGSSTSKPALGNWPGVASVRLAYFLTFLIAKPTEKITRITFKADKIHVSSARFAAQWMDSGEVETCEQLNLHANTLAKENTIKYKCKSCRRKQGIPLYNILSSAFLSDKFKKILLDVEKNDHGFICISCGNTWAEQVT